MKCNMSQFQQQSPPSFRNCPSLRPRWLTPRQGHPRQLGASLALLVQAPTSTANAGTSAEGAQSPSSGGSECSSQADKPGLWSTVAAPLPSLPPELTAVALVYFVQGIMELATLAQTYHLKDELHANPATVALFLSLTGIPWTIKPVIGFISDTVPLWGYRRSSYLMLASIAGTVSYLWMGQGPPSMMGFLGAMLLCSTACAVSDVVVDSLVVERARGETQEAAGSLQSLCWASYALAQVITASLSGSLVQEFGPRVVFELTAMFPLLVAAASLLLKEDKVTTTTTTLVPASATLGSTTVLTTQQDTATAARSVAATGAVGVLAVNNIVPRRRTSSSGVSVEGSCTTDGCSTCSTQCRIDARYADLVAHLDDDSHHSTQHRTDSTAHSGDSVTAISASSNPAVAKGALAAAAAAQAEQLWQALWRPDVAAPLAFLLLLSATPSADSALFYYQTEELGFTAGFLGQVQLAAACASFAGVLLYSSSLKRVPVRPLMLWGTLLAAVLQLSQLVLVSGVHRQWGVDDTVVVLGGSVVLDVVKNVLSMPTMVLAARLCPPGLEATMFATIMSLINLADGVRVAGGAALMSALHVSPSDWSGLPTLLGVCNASLLLPLLLLNNIPDMTDNSSSSSSSSSTPGVATQPQQAATQGTPEAMATADPGAKAVVPASAAEVSCTDMQPAAVYAATHTASSSHTPQQQSAAVAVVSAIGDMTCSHHHAVLLTEAPPDSCTPSSDTADTDSDSSPPASRSTSPAPASLFTAPSTTIPLVAGIGDPTAVTPTWPVSTPDHTAPVPYPAAAGQQLQGVTSVIVPLPNRLSVVSVPVSTVHGARRLQRQLRRRLRKRGAVRYFDGGLYTHSALLDEECDWSVTPPQMSETKSEQQIRSSGAQSSQEPVVSAW